MSHRVVQEHWEIKRGTTIEYREAEYLINPQGVPTLQGDPEIAECLGRANGCLCIKTVAGSRMIPENWYVCSLMISPDLRAALIIFRSKLVKQGISGHTLISQLTWFTQAWVLCEKVYGIDSEGSSPTDRRREVAFAILKGDPPALDMATDVLGRA